MPKGVPNKGYTPEFKVMVIETIRKEGVSYCEAAREFELSSDTRTASWERIYLREGAEGFRVERRGRGSKGCPAKLPPQGKAKGLAACDSQTASPLGCLI